MKVSVIDDRFRAERFVLNDLREVETELIAELQKGESADAQKVSELHSSLQALWSLIELEAVWPEPRQSANG